MKIVASALSWAAHAVFFADALVDEGPWQTTLPPVWGPGQPYTLATGWGSSVTPAPVNPWSTHSPTEQLVPPKSFVYPKSSSLENLIQLLPPEPTQQQGLARGLREQPGGLVQHRTRVSNSSALIRSAPARLPGVTSAAPVASAFSNLRNSNTGHALEELAERVHHAFQRPQGGAIGSEAVVPVENIKGVLEELAKLSAVIRDLCEAERRGGGSPPQLGHIGSIYRIGSATDRFPVRELIELGRSYSRRLESHLIAARRLLSAVLGPNPGRETMVLLVQEFRKATADSKEVYQAGSQVTSAVVSGVLPYVSSCSFFTNGGVHETSRLWSLVGARAASASRYLHQALDIFRKVAPSLVDFASGSIEAQSVGDFAKSKPFYKISQYMNRAEARSISSITYFNQLAAAYQDFINPKVTAPPTAGEKHRPVAERKGQVYTELEPSGNNQDYVEVADYAEDNAEMSLMAEDLGSEYATPPHVVDSTEGDVFADSAAMQRVVDSNLGVGRTPKQPQEPEAELFDYELQTVASD